MTSLTIMPDEILLVIREDLSAKDILALANVSCGVHT